jgi:hypothetical protein
MHGPRTYLKISSNVASAGYRHVTDADGTGFNAIKYSECIGVIKYVKILSMLCYSTGYRARYAPVVVAL